MNLNTLLTSSVTGYTKGFKGATLANYVECKQLLKDENGKIIGAKLHDKVGGKEFDVKSKVVVNCTGIHADELRKIDNPNVKDRI
jgi:glycerol-3-phosphate dehydrogenase